MRNCKDCGRPYEPTGKGGRCLACRRKWDRGWRARRKAAGNPVISTKMPREYHANYAARYFTDPAKRRQRNANMRRYAKLHPERHLARSRVHHEIEAGRLVPQPCFCGANAQAHHDDYSKPLDVRWLCPVHHREYHAKAEGR